MKKSPLNEVNERFENKEGLVKAVKALASDDLWIDRLNEDKGLELVSNNKLLRLHEVLTKVQSDFGGRESLIDEILKLEKRGKDEGYKNRLSAHSTPRLYDRYLAAKKKSA